MGFSYIQGAKRWARAAREPGGPVLTEHHRADRRTAIPVGVHDAPVGPEDGSALLSAILASLEDDKAENVVTIPLAGKSDLADHMVVASGRSTRQVVAIAEKLVERLKAGPGVRCRTEGAEVGDWVLIDAGDVIVHVFRPEVRDFYQLEKMWMPPPRAVAEAR
jgi:ribosome-associated protein